MRIILGIVQELDAMTIIQGIAKELVTGTRLKVGCPWRFGALRGPLASKYIVSRRTMRTYNAGTGSALVDSCALSLKIKRPDSGSIFFGFFKRDPT